MHSTDQYNRGKKEFAKYSVFLWKLEKRFCRLGLRENCLSGNKLLRYRGADLFIIFQNKHILRYQRLFVRLSRPHSWYNRSLDVPFMAPVIASAALY